MSDSILTTTKKVLGLAESYTAFDTDVIMHLNSALSVLDQIGVGPTGGVYVTDTTRTWASMGMPPEQLALTKSYIFLRVKALFDPPPTSFAIEAMNEQIKQFEWRLNVMREGAVEP